jgi:hypothetical protein
VIKHLVDREEVLQLIAMVENPEMDVDTKLKAIKRLEYITGRPLPGTKAFRKIRDEYLSGGDMDTLATKEAEFGAETPKAARTRSGQGVGRGGGRHP